MLNKLISISGSMSMCMCVCVHVCMGKHACTIVCVCLRVHVYVNVCQSLSVSLCVCVSYLSLCVYVYVFIYVSSCVFVSCVRLYECFHAFAYAYMWVPEWAWDHVCVLACFVCVWMCTYMYVCVCGYVCVCASAEREYFYSKPFVFPLWRLTPVLVVATHHTASDDFYANTVQHNTMLFFGMLVEYRGLPSILILPLIFVYTFS